MYPIKHLRGRKIRQHRGTYQHGMADLPGEPDYLGRNFRAYTRRRYRIRKTRRRQLGAGGFQNNNTDSMADFRAYVHSVYRGYFRRERTGLSAHYGAGGYADDRKLDVYAGLRRFDKQFIERVQLYVRAWYVLNRDFVRGVAYAQKDYG